MIDEESWHDSYIFTFFIENFQGYLSCLWPYTPGSKVPEGEYVVILLSDPDPMGLIIGHDGLVGEKKTKQFIDTIGTNNSLYNVQQILTYT